MLKRSLAFTTGLWQHGDGVTLDDEEVLPMAIWHHKLQEIEEFQKSCDTCTSEVSSCANSDASEDHVIETAPIDVEVSDGE
mmetsp:Transcript_36031/g.84500  ORF Transcript_36031/g.84500 Transcript_36031/m.84500 type:complete len:81 (+) Transcript_36031:125-367(+)